MEIELLDSTFKWIGVIDKFSSLIWTDRYDVFGDMEITFSPTPNMILDINNTSYLRLKESEHIMIPEINNITTNIIKGDKFTLKGRSLESILERRIVWSETTLNGNFQTAILDLLNNNFINPSIEERAIGNFLYETSTDPIITALTVDEQFTGDYIYDVISVLCKSKSIGFRVRLTEFGYFLFKLYAGVDRSRDQTSKPIVEFSSDLDNLINSDYISTNQFLKNVIMVAGEKGVGNTRLTSVVALAGPPSGLERREMYKEANDISRNTSSGQLTEAEYLALLTGRGNEELAKNTFIEAFDGEVDTTMYKYGVDFFMGDILQISNSYGFSAKSRVTELIFSQDDSGIKIYPTFTRI